MRQVGRLFKQAQEVAQSVTTWADLSNALFNPVDGLVTTAYPTREERAAFLRTEEYRKIRQLLTNAIEKHGLVKGATPKKSGRFMVRLPPSLHAVLEREAAHEGVSLNHLVVTKLAVPLRSLALRVPSRR